MPLDAHWMPFTANKTFKQQPKMLASAKGMYWQSKEQRNILDMTAGLWCVNLGHGREEVARAMYEASCKLDYAPSFGFGHDASFELAERLVALAPANLQHVFFTNSGSESVDTAMKMALAYHAARGQAGKRLFIGRQRGYHGVNFGGTSAGGISPNRQFYAQFGQVDHLSDILDIKSSAFSKGQPEVGVDKAEELDRLLRFHGADSVAAVILEPIQGAGGVIVPPKGYLERIREICNQHGVLLIFDEVVCAFGRTGAFTAAQQFNVQPDIMTMAKGLTSGCVPMGAVLCSGEIYQTTVQDAPVGIEFFHGYTYSAHPVACAAALACLDIYQREELFTRAASGIGAYFEEALHHFAGLKNVIDIRNYGLVGAIEFAAAEDNTAVGVKVFNQAWEMGLMIRGLGNAAVVSPPLVIEKQHIDEFVDKLDTAIHVAMV